MKWHPTAVIFRKKCGRWHFENAVGRENAAKPRPVEAQNTVHRARWILAEHVCKTLLMFTENHIRLFILLFLLWFAEKN